MTIAAAIAMRIDELLRKHQYTQYRLSVLSGVPQSTISAIRLQKNKAVNVRIIHELSQGFGIDLTEFFDSPLFTRENICE